MPYPDNFNEALHQDAYGDKPEDTDAQELADLVDEARKIAEKFATKLNAIHELNVRCGGGFTREDRFAAKVEFMKDVATEGLVEHASGDMARRIYRELEARHG